MTNLSHGLMQQEVPVYTCSAMYHIVVVFDNPSIKRYENVLNSILETEQLMQDKFPESEYANLLLSQLRQRFQALNRQPSRNHPSNRQLDSTATVNRQPNRQPNRPVMNNRNLTTIGAVDQDKSKPSNAQSRTKRGLFNIVASVSKTLFGLATEEDVNKIRQLAVMNEQTLSVLTHHSTQMLSILNATRYQMIENRNTVNKLIESLSELKEFATNSYMKLHLYHVLLLKIILIQNLVENLEHTQDKMLRMRKDLENGYLSEDLLPLEEFKSLITSATIPTGSHFVTPIHWYYSKLAVRMLKIENEIVYAVDLPLVSSEKFIAKRFISYPTPTVNRNTTVQIMVDKNRLYKNHDGRAIALPENCIGTHIQVCPPSIISRDQEADGDCVSALLNLTQSKVDETCPAQLSISRKDRLFYHDVNSFILVTWGTDLVDGCLKSKVLTLKPGTYLIEWSGTCALCTKHHCVPGISYSTTRLQLNNTWQAFPIPNMQNFSALMLPVKIPAVMATPKVTTLSELTSPPEPRIVWSASSTSVLIDVIVFIMFISCGVIVCIMIKVYRSKQSKVDVSRDLEHAVPLVVLNQSNEIENSNMSPEQAAAILLASNVN